MKKANAFKRACRKSKVALYRSSPMILTVLSSAGVVVTVIFAVKATPKALEIINEAESKKGDKLNVFEMARFAGPLYIPSFLFGMSTIFCIFGTTVLNRKRQTSLIGAYTLLDNTYREYRKKVMELYGKDTDLKIRGEIAKEKFEPCDIQSSMDQVLFYDEYSNRYFWRTMLEVTDAEYYLNRNLALRSYASLNEFYEFLGLEPTEQGEILGWDLAMGSEFYGYSWVDFVHELCQDSTDPDMPPYYYIRMPFEPHQGYIECW